MPEGQHKATLETITKIRNDNERMINNTDELDSIYKADMTGWNNIITMELYRRVDKPEQDGTARRVHAQVNNALMARKYTQDTNKGVKQQKLRKDQAVEQAYKKEESHYCSFQLIVFVSDH